MNFTIINGDYPVNNLNLVAPARSIKFTAHSRNGIQSKSLFTTLTAAKVEAPLEQTVEPVITDTIMDKATEEFFSSNGYKKLKLPTVTFNNVKKHGSNDISATVSISPLSPHYTSLNTVISEETIPVVDPTIEESNEELAKLDDPVWKVGAPEESFENISVNIEEDPKESVIEQPISSVEVKEEIPVNEIPQVKPYEKSFTPTDTPSIATGLEESDLAKKAREAIQARIKAAEEKATQVAEAEIAKAKEEAVKAREEAAQAKKAKETVEEELSKTRSDLDNLSEEVRKAQQEAMSAKTKVAAYEEVLKEFTSPVDDVPLSRAA